MEFTNVSVDNVQIHQDVLYASVAHRTYSKLSNGYNAYLVAVELNTGQIKWLTEPLTCISEYYIYNDVIFTGYGFTDEPDYIYIVDKASGSRVASVKIEKAPSYFAVKDGKLYVRTYSLDYTFAIIK